MRWLPLLTLAGCMPISADEYARGPLDGGEPSAEVHDDAGAPAPSMDAALADAGEAAPLDASGVQDASHAIEASVLDAAVEPIIDCKTPGVLCDDFEQGLMCPGVAGPRWSECEHIADETGPRIFPPGPVISHAMLSRVAEPAGMRSQRLIRRVPLDVDAFTSEFSLHSNPSSNPYFTFLKLQQETGKDARGEPIAYPGISLVSREGRMVLVIETVSSLGHAPDQVSIDLRAMPEDWLRVYFELQLQPKIKVNVAFDEYSESWSQEFDVSKVPPSRQYFAVGVYTELAGEIGMLFDDLRAYAKKDGKVSPLL
jgi:hypothetical protein